MWGANGDPGCVWGRLTFLSLAPEKRAPETPPGFGRIKRHSACKAAACPSHGGCATVISCLHLASMLSRPSVSPVQAWAVLQTVLGDGGGSKATVVWERVWALGASCRPLLGQPLFPLLSVYLPGPSYWALTSFLLAWGENRGKEK